MDSKDVQLQNAELAIRFVPFPRVTFFSCTHLEKVQLPISSTSCNSTSSNFLQSEKLGSLLNIVPFVSFTEHNKETFFRLGIAEKRRPPTFPPLLTVIFSKHLQSSKGEEKPNPPCTLPFIISSFKLLHLSKADVLTSVCPLIVTFLSAEHPSKAHPSISSTVCGIVISSKFRQFLKHSKGIFFKERGN